jgi:hypothetical protein
VSLDDWLLALHVLSAFAFVAGIVLFWVLVVALRRTDTPEGTTLLIPVGKVGNASIAIGATGTIVLGIWLAISLDAHRVWDPWVVAALVLWVLAAETGRRAGAAYEQTLTKARELVAAGTVEPSPELLALNRSSRIVLMHGLTTVIVLLIVIDMIWKPGA